MSAQILFVCPDPYFAKFFTNYVSSAQYKFSLICFTDEATALTYWQEHQDHIQAILAYPSFLEQCKGNSTLSICISDVTCRSGSADELQTLNIYQPRRDTLADLQLILSPHLGLSKQLQKRGNAKVISFFSTQGGSGKSTMAYLTALRASQEGKAAYLSLEPSPFSQQFYSQPQSSVSGEDLIYSIRDRQDPVKAILPALLHNTQNVYIFPSSQSLQDLLELTVEDWEFLLDSLLQYGEMDYIILDLGSELTRVNRMAFDYSNLAALVFTDDHVGLGKRDRFLNDPNFAQLGLSCPYLEIRNKCRHKQSATGSLIPVPFSKTIDSGESLSIALGGNIDFFNACSLLLQAAEREG